MQKTIDIMVENTSDAIITIDAFGYIKSLNKNAEKLLGYRSDELSGKAMSLMYMDQKSQDQLNEKLALAKANGLVGNVFMYMRTKDGTEGLPCEQVIRSVIDDENNLAGYMILTKELATKKLLEDQQDQLSKTSHEAQNQKAQSELKTQFIYNISHDLKTPLTNIKGFAKLLLENEFGEVNKEQREYITIITSEADRLLQLIQQMLDVAKLSSDKIRLDRQQVNLRELANNPSLNALKEVAEKKGLEFLWSIDYSVPDIQADPNRLIQVFANLIGNAIKFTEKGSIKVNITRKGKKNVMIEIIDTGVGISREDKAKLFRKFYQLQRKNLTVPEGSGTGLGLSIARGIVSLHGGRIGVNSEPGKGSTFWFSLPIVAKPKKAKAEQ